jgi:hypothetical protein
MRRPRCMLGLLLRATSCCCVPAFYAMHCAGMHALCMPYANMFARSALHAERQLGRNATTADATPRFHFAERRHFFFFPGVGRWRRSGTGEGSAWPRSSVCKDQEAGRHDAPGAWDTRAESEKNARNGHDRHILFWACHRTAQEPATLCFCFKGAKILASHGMLLRGCS